MREWLNHMGPILWELNMQQSAFVDFQALRIKEEFGLWSPGSMA